MADKHYRIAGTVAINDAVKLSFSIGQVKYSKRCISFW
jgi:hypothetical protein